MIETYEEIAANPYDYIPERMTACDAIEVLRKYNEWRKHDDQVCDPPFCPEQISDAIDAVIAALQPAIIPTLDNLLEAVSFVTGIGMETLLDKTRHREYSEARFMYFWLAYYYTNHTLTAIAERVNRRHSIVIYGIRQGNEWIANPLINPEWVKKINGIINRVKKGEHGKE